MISWDWALVSGDVSPGIPSPSVWCEDLFIQEIFRDLVVTSASHLSWKNLPDIATSSDVCYGFFIQFTC